MSTMQVVGDSLWQTKKALARLSQMSANREALEMAERYDAKRMEADALRLENDELRESIIDLRGQLTATEKAKERAKLAANWSRGSWKEQHDSVALSLNANEKLLVTKDTELSKVKRQSKVLREGTIKALERQQAKEREHLKRAQLAEARQFAATLVQKVVRRRHAAAEQEAQRAKEALVDTRRLAGLQMSAAKDAIQTQRILVKFHGSHMSVRAVDGSVRLLRDAISDIVHALPTSGNDEGALGVRGPMAKYTRELVLGRPESAALGIVSFLKVDLFDLFERCHRGLDAIRDEWFRNGTLEDVECVKYVLDEPAGSSAKEFANGTRDAGRTGETLEDFVRKPESQKAQLTTAHVAALRMYTTACFRSINEPLRNSERTGAHPFPATVFFLTDAIKRLRAVHVDCSDIDGSCDSVGTGDDVSIDLWRGMKDVVVESSSEFQANGGSEFAPMSTTSNLDVAVAYGMSQRSLLFKITSKNFMARGADISYLSCFPGEQEYLFPPLTFVRAPLLNRTLIIRLEQPIAPSADTFRPSRMCCVSSANSSSQRVGHKKSFASRAPLREDVRSSSA